MAKCRECGKSNPLLKLDPSGICRECYLADLNAITEQKAELEEHIRKLKMDLHDVKYQILQAKRELDSVSAQSSDHDCRTNRQEEAQTPGYRIVYTQNLNRCTKSITNKASVPARSEPVVPAQKQLTAEEKPKHVEQFWEAVKIVVTRREASVSLLMEYMGVDFDQAARLLKRMEQKGFVSAPKGSEARNVLVSYDDVKHSFEG